MCLSRSLCSSQSAAADEATDKLRRLKDCIIKGGTLFNLAAETSDVHPSLYTPAKTKSKSRRKTVAPKPSAFDLGDSDDEFSVAKAAVGGRRKSVGTALLRARPNLAMSPAGAPSSLALLSQADRNERRQSTDSVSSRGSTGSRDKKVSMSPADKDKRELSTELSLLKQALAAKGQQNKNLKSTMADLTAKVKELEEQKDVAAKERDEIGNECEDMIKENQELNEKLVFIETEGSAIREEQARTLEASKMLREEFEAVKAALVEKAKKINATEFDLASARDDNDDLLEDKKELEVAAATMQEQIAMLTEQVATLTEANREHEKNAVESKAEVTGLQELLQNSNIAIEEARQTAVELSSELETAKEEVNDALAMAEDYKNQAEDAVEAAKVASANEELLEEMEKLKTKVRCEALPHASVPVAYRC